MLSREFFSQEHAARAVQQVSGACQIESVADGKASYWARTYFVRTPSTEYFVKQTTNAEKAAMSQGEPGATQLARENDIPCPLALRVFDAGELGSSSLPTVVYESIESAEHVLDGSDIAPGEMTPAALRQVAVMLARINSIPSDKSASGFARENSPNYRKQLQTLLAKSSLITDQQKDAIDSMMQSEALESHYLHHFDFYPANILFEIIENSPQLLSIVDWEWASFAPLGSDLLGLSSTAVQYHLNPETALEAYRVEMNISPKALKDALMTFGMTNALLLHNRIESIFARDPQAITDKKVQLMVSWLNAYTQVATRYA